MYLYTSFRRINISRCEPVSMTLPMKDADYLICLFTEASRESSDQQARSKRLCFDFTHSESQCQQEKYTRQILPTYDAHLRFYLSVVNTVYHHHQQSSRWITQRSNSFQHRCRITLNESDSVHTSHIDFLVTPVSRQSLSTVKSKSGDHHVARPWTRHHNNSTGHWVEASVIVSLF